MTFQLKEKGKLLKEIRRPILKMDIETLHENNTSNKQAFPFSHTMASFTLPKDDKKRNLQVYILGPKKNVIYSAPVPRKRKKERKEQNVVLIDKTQQKGG